jgi:hypothetical protein
MPDAMPDAMPNALPDSESSAIHVRTYARTDALTESLPTSQRHLDLPLRAHSHAADSEIAELRAERDHWRAMYDAMTAAARAGIKSRIPQEDS